MLRLDDVARIAELTVDRHVRPEERDEEGREGSDADRPLAGERPRERGRAPEHPGRDEEGEEEADGEAIVEGGEHLRPQRRDQHEERAPTASARNRAAAQRITGSQHPICTIGEPRWSRRLGKWAKTTRARRLGTTRPVSDQARA